MLSLLIPERCLHCDRPTANSVVGKRPFGLGKYLCSICIRVTELIETPDEDSLRDQLEMTAPDLDFNLCASAFVFLQDSPVQSLIHSLKYCSMPRLGELLGTMLADRVPSKNPLLIPIPLHRTRLAERGYNQAERIAVGMSRDKKMGVIEALVRTRPTPTQTSLSIQERLDNVRGAFALSRNASLVRGRHVLLIDDVMTTGSTIASAAETLLAAQPASIGCVTLSAARHPSAITSA